MLRDVLGVFFIMLGMLWVIKPGVLKNRLKRKMTRRLKFIVYGFVLVFGFILIGSVLGAPGRIPKIVGIIGMIVVIQGILLLSSKASGKIETWISDRPLWLFRIWALVVILLGVMLVLA